MNKSQTVGSLASAGSCVWNFGNDIAKVTKTDFGKAKQYGTSDVARYGGTLTSAVLANPELASGCATIPPVGPPGERLSGLGGRPVTGRAGGDLGYDFRHAMPRNARGELRCGWAGNPWGAGGSP